MMRILALVLFLTLATPAFATDGVLEINQACATSASGCFPGDAAGFPVTITQQGSYRLTGNISSPQIITTAIQINAPMVTLDLGGFVVSGTNVCTGYPTTGCAVTNGAPGINSDNFFVVVRNGSVMGMGGEGVRLNGASSRVDDVQVLGCGWDGISVGGAGRVSHSESAGNYRYGIRLTDGGTAFDNESRANGNSGFLINGASHAAFLKENRAYDNASFGIFGDSGTLTNRNVATGNASGTILFTTSLGDNLCGTTRC